MKAKIRDTEIYFDIEGCGLVADGNRMREKPVAFLVHGGPGADHTAFKPLFSSLSDRLQLVYFDHRGQGRSARGAKETYTLENNVEDIEALRQYLGLEKIIIIGTSYGGMVALSYATRYPQMVSRLIAIATAADSRFLQRAKENLAAKGTSEQQAIARKLWNGNFENEAELKAYFQIMAPMYSLTHQPESTRNWERTIFSVDAINMAFGSFLLTYDLSDRLHLITCPTLVIGARQDWICPPEFSEDIARAIPNARLEIIENSGHLIRADRPEVLLHLIGDFIGG